PLPYPTLCRSRGVEHAVLDDEDILTRTLRHIALRVQQQRFVGASGNRFLQSQHRVDVGATGLGAGHGDVDVVTGKGTGADLDAVGQGFLAHVGAPVPGGDDPAHPERVGADAHAFGAVERQRTDVGAVQVVFTHGGEGGFVDLILGEGDLHAHDVCRIEQAVGVCLQAEDRRALRSLVGAHAFEHAHAVV